MRSARLPRSAAITWLPDSARCFTADFRAQSRRCHRSPPLRACSSHSPDWTPINGFRPVARSGNRQNLRAIIEPTLARSTFARSVHGSREQTILNLPLRYCAAAGVRRSKRSMVKAGNVCQTRRHDGRPWAGRQIRTCRILVFRVLGEPAAAMKPCCSDFHMSMCAQSGR